MNASEQFFLFESMEKGRARLLRYDENGMTYVSGNEGKLRKAFEMGARSASELKAQGLGSFAVAKNIAYEEVVKLQANERTGATTVRFKKSRGPSEEVEIRIKNLQHLQSMLDYMGSKLTEGGLVRQQRKESPVSVLVFPTLVMIVALIVGGALTTLQGADGGIDTSELDNSGGRSARKARGIVSLLAILSNLLGFWGSLLITLVVVAIGALLAFLRVSNRANVISYER
ncbi:MAG TPA: hypothetical protein DDW52_25860 [Planctomycetaceae bacterium]|nr:hypothetical protein [Planctomycetaceae bacterium]